MAVVWSSSAAEDLRQLHAWLEPVDAEAAASVVALLVGGVRRLARFPRLGARLPEFAPREVRRLLVGDYEIRYELAERNLYVLRVWHQRESR